MMFSVFLHPVFLFSHLTMSYYLDQKLRARVAGWVEQRLSPRLHQAGSAEPLLQASSVVCRAGPRPSAVSLPGVGTIGRGSTGGFLSK